MKPQSFCLVLLALLAVDLTAVGQAPWSWSLSGGPEVTIEETAIPHPFTGGLSAPQWSEIDVDWDGDMDLFAFDRDGSRILVFEKTVAGDWKERPDWSQGWPALKHWVLLRDFDCDGLPDLFTGYQNSIHVYRNTTATPGVPTFEPYALPLTASWDFGTGAQELPLVCLTIDKPAIFDVDNDGDLDFICFTETSTSLYRFSGQSACGLDLVCTNRCYGMVSEGSEDNTLFIGDDHSCSFNVLDPEGRPGPIEAEAAERDGLHAGGAITALQFDGENFHDLLISDVTYPTMSGLMLEDAADGQDSTAWVDMAFPALVPHTGEADSIVLQRFPAAYPIDPDNDGDWDLVVSPNIALEIDDDQCVQLWENQGTAEEPLWALASDRWIQDGTIDVGRGAIPVLHDLDGDGDLDLAIGNKERYEGVNDTPTALALFENTGTASQPAFAWRTWGAIDFGFNGIESGHPAFADLDGDGDNDLIVGDELGLLHAYINTAEPGSWPVWTLDQLAVQNAEGEAIDVGQFAAPQLIDVNADELIDLVIGEKNGTLSLYVNCGSPSTPSWCLQTTPEFEASWAGIQVNNALGINGYSTPCLYMDGVDLHIAAGNELGEIQYFGILDPADILAPLEATGPSLNASMRGLRSSGTLGDVNSDGIPELVVGIQNGGLRWFNGTTVDITGYEPPERPMVAPNPASAGGWVRIELPQASRMAWIDVQGRMVQPCGLKQAGDAWLAVPTTPGLYLLTTQPAAGGMIRTVRVVVQ
ncbi:MAG: FG-GAP repeat domain-containing protein [Flavobacteriales bacterium]